MSLVKKFSVGHRKCLRKSICKNVKAADISVDSGKGLSSYLCPRKMSREFTNNRTIPRIPHASKILN
jgi:hypothetical protein